jgi:hypothetical protein
MRSNEFVTPFWKDALASLPEEVRYRYSLQMHAAERWELGFGWLIETISRASAGIGRLFHTPRGAH